MSCKVKMADIKRSIAKSFGVSVIELESHSHLPHIVAARRIAIYLIKVIIKRSDADIGYYFGFRRGGVIFCSVASVEKQMAVDRDFCAQVTKLEQAIREKFGEFSNGDDTDSKNCANRDPVEAHETVSRGQRPGDTRQRFG